jgi:hypothetical protein
MGSLEFTIITLWDPWSSQYSLQHKFYKTVKISNKLVAVWYVTVNLLRSIWVKLKYWVVRQPGDT